MSLSGHLGVTVFSPKKINDLEAIVLYTVEVYNSTNPPQKKRADGCLVAYMQEITGIFQKSPSPFRPATQITPLYPLPRLRLAGPNLGSLTT